MSNYIERIKLLTELFDEGHISEQEFGELVDSLRGGAVNEAYDVENDKLTLGGGFEIGVEHDVEGFEEDHVRGFEDYHECKRTDIPETEPDMPLTAMYEEQDNPLTSEDKEFDGAFRDYLDSKGEWERVIKTVKGKQVPVWIPINKRVDSDKMDAYEGFLNKARNPLHNTLYHEIEAGEVRKSVDGWNRATGLYKEDVHSGNTLIKPTIYQ